MNVRPYIGITDFLSHDQVLCMLHVGVMMSYKTLNGVASSGDTAFPPKECIADIFDECSVADDLFYCLHYVDHTHSTTASDVARAIGYAGPWVNALQLDMTWPDPDMIAAAVFASLPQPELILQIGRHAMVRADHDPRMVVQRLKRYEGLVSRVLLDMSMGEGRAMHAGELFTLSLAILEVYPHLGIGVAGGLGPNTMYLVAPLARMIHGLSIDAQSRLRPSGDAHDPIDWQLAAEYLRLALALLP